jgi:hypothetical protein
MYMERGWRSGHWLHDLQQRLGMDDLFSLVWLGGICIWGYINGV